MEKIAKWKDVVQKAHAILRGFRGSGVNNVLTTPRRVKDFNKIRHIEADVTSTTGNTYHSRIMFVPGTRRIAIWGCECEWSKYVWERSPRYRHLEGRPCSHVYALYLYYQSGLLKREWEKWRPKNERG